ncbi:MAG: hypothetical protein ACREBE_10270, partial [bacterium]
GALQMQAESGFRSTWSAFSSGVAGVGSFLSSSWGGVRFGATAAWNGLSWLGSQLSSGVRWAAAGALAGAGLAWSAYRRALPESIPGGIFPDESVPGGIVQSIVGGGLQFANQRLEIYDVTPAPGNEAKVTRRLAPISCGNLYLNGQVNALTDAVSKGARAFGDRPFILLYGGTQNLISDSVESALMKFAPSTASRQLADILAGTSEATHLIAHSQGALTAFWGHRLAGDDLSNVQVDFFGPATSSLAYRFALATSGANAGPFSYLARVNDPVATFLGGNFTGGWWMPVLFSLRIVASAPFIPALPFENLSPHSSYP